MFMNLVLCRSYIGIMVDGVSIMVILMWFLEVEENSNMVNFVLCCGWRVNYFLLDLCSEYLVF